jgi:exodeoxyribonuclease VII small subunit
MPPQSSPLSQLSFEDAMDRLESIVSAMEGERMPLEEMVQSYEDGARLLQLCRQRIDTARQRVEQITQDLDGRVQLSPFDPQQAEPEPAIKPQRAATTTTTRRAPAKPSTDDDDIRLF